MTHPLIELPHAVIDELRAAWLAALRSKSGRRQLRAPGHRIAELVQAAGRLSRPAR
jgi:hypothetical protein